MNVKLSGAAAAGILVLVVGGGVVSGVLVQGAGTPPPQTAPPVVGAHQVVNDNAATPSATPKATRASGPTEDTAPHASTNAGAHHAADDTADPKPEPTDHPHPGATPPAASTAAATGDPRPTCTFDGTTYTLGERRWGPYDAAGHRTQYECHMVYDGKGLAHWMAFKPTRATGPCGPHPYGYVQAYEDGYTYYCGRDAAGNLVWTDVKPPAADPADPVAGKTGD